MRGTLRTSELTGEVDLFQDFLGVLDPVAVDGRRDVDEEVDGVRHINVKVGRCFVAVQRGSGNLAKSCFSVRSTRLMNLLNACW